MENNALSLVGFVLNEIIARKIQNENFNQFSEHHERNINFM